MHNTDDGSTTDHKLHYITSRYHAPDPSEIATIGTKHAARQQEVAIRPSLAALHDGVGVASALVELRDKHTVRSFLSSAHARAATRHPRAHTKVKAKDKAVEAYIVPQ